MLRRAYDSIWLHRILALGALLALLVVIVAAFGFGRGVDKPATTPPPLPTNVTHVDPLPPPNPVARYAGAPPPVDCVAASTPHVHVWLANPSGATAGVTPAQVRAAILDANGYVNETASPGTASLRVVCDAGGQLLVSPISTTDGSFSTVAQAVQSADQDGAPVRELIMVNQASPSYYAGLGQIGAVSGSRYFAAVWQFPIGDLLLHELTHSLSAVQGSVHAPGAPNATGSAHCRDGLDVECYNDGGPWGAQIYPYRCRVEVWDCNRDDYANPCPPAGSWLATHPEFNLLGPQEQFIDVNAACSGGGTTTTTTTVTTSTQPTSSTTTTTTTPPPTSLAAPANYRVTIKTCTSLGIAWDAVTGASSYVVQRRRAEDGTTWTYLGRVPYPRFNGSWTLNGTYTYRSAGVDSAGRQGAYGQFVASRAC